MSIWIVKLQWNKQWKIGKLMIYSDIYEWIIHDISWKNANMQMIKMCTLRCIQDEKKNVITFYLKITQKHTIRVIKMKLFLKMEYI